MTASTPPNSRDAHTAAYVPPTLEELAIAVREAREKANTLHRERMKSHDEMCQAQAQHAFLATACRHAEDAVSRAVHALESQVHRETWEAVS